MKLDLILKDVTDPIMRENFARTQAALNQQVVLQPDFAFIEFDVPYPSLSYGVPHGLNYQPTDVIFLSCTGDQNFYFRYDQFDGNNIYVAAHGPVRIRALLGRIEEKGKRPLKDKQLPFVAPKISTSDGLGGSGSDGWAFIQDSAHSSSTPLSVLANTRTLITNNGAGALTNYVNAPANASSWWDATHSKFWPSQNGEFYTFRLNLTFVPTQNNKTITLDYDIGTTNLPWVHTFYSASGAGNAVKLAPAIPAPIGPSAFSNGIAFYITSECDLTVYGISLTVIRDFHK